MGNEDLGIKVDKKKLTLVSISKNEARQVYRLKKEQEVLPAILEMLIRDLGFDSAGIDIEFYFGFPTMGDGEKVMITSEGIENPWSLKYEDINDLDLGVYSLFNARYDLEVAILPDKVELIVRSRKDYDISNIGTLLEKYALFPREE